MKVETKELKKRLPTAKQIAADLYGIEWHGNQARCPRASKHAHGDRDPSFGYLDGENRLHCFSQLCFGEKPVDVIDFVRQMDGCSFPQAVARLTERYSVDGVTKDTNGRNPKRVSFKAGGRTQLERDGWREVATYSMGDGIRKVRFEHPGRLQPEKSRPDKTFIWEHLDSDNTWKPGRGSKAHLAYVNLPFRELDQIECALGVESERSADAVGAFGIPAFSFKELNDAIAATFVGLHVRLLPDKDKAGRRLMHQRIELLRPHARIISTIEPPSDWPEAGDIYDAISGMAWGQDRIDALVATALRSDLPQDASLEKSAQPMRTDTRGDADNSHFEDLGAGRYRLRLGSFGISIEVDRLRRDRHELFGELSVYSCLPETLIAGKAISTADLNLSSARAREDRAKFLAQRSQTKTLDWVGVIEEFCQLVLVADRKGQVAVDLRTLSRPAADDALEIEGLSLLRRHPSIIFGDGGAAKSYLCLYLIGCLAERGLRVALFDWELAGEDHRDRLERLFGPAMPKVVYARCEKPLVYEVDRLQRIVRDDQIEFAMFDSVVFACDGPPESAEVAGRYFGAVRQIGIGSLHIAHVSKGENAEQKPFGSAFWYNGARAIWYAKLASERVESDKLNLGLFNRKANLGRLRPPVGFTVSFSEDRTAFRRTDVADSPDLAKQLTIRQRMIHLLRRGAMTPEVLADEIEAEVDSIKLYGPPPQEAVCMDGGRPTLPARNGTTLNRRTLDLRTLLLSAVRRVSVCSLQPIDIEHNGHFPGRPPGLSVSPAADTAPFRGCPSVCPPLLSVSNIKGAAPRFVGSIKGHPLRRLPSSPLGIPING